MQVSGSLLGLLGLHHGHDVLSGGSDDDVPAPETPVSSDSAPQTPANTQFQLTAAHLQAIMPQIQDAEAWTPYIGTALQRWDINTPERAAMFLANCALECDQCRHMQEEWGPDAAQRLYEPPSRVAKVLGNTQGGDGERFKGRGAIQITGRDNYTRAGKALGVDFVTSPALACTQDHAWQVAGWFWSGHGLNGVADAGNFDETVRVINGGLTDLAQRQTFYARAKTAFGLK